MMRGAALATAAVVLAACDDGTAVNPEPAIPVVVRVTVAPSLDTLTYLQQQLQLHATAFDSAGDSIPGTPFTWHSTAPSAVSVTPTGLVRALGNGGIVITAITDNGVFDTAVVVVSQVPTRLVFTLQPAGAVERMPFQPPVLVEERDAHGSLVLRGSDAISLALLPTGNGARVVAPTVFAVAGTANFQIAAVDRAGVGYRFIGLLRDVPSDTSAAFDVTPNITWVSLRSRSSHTCGVSSTGAAYCWGLNTSGQLGNGSTSPTPTSLPGLVLAPQGVAFASISTGTSHTCALTPAGDAFCWGSGFGGLLGIGPVFTSQLSPAAVASPAGVHYSAIDAGTVFSCALASPSIYCWGDNAFGEVGNGASNGFVGSPTAVAAPAGASFTAVGVGSVHACGLTSVGSVYCWGRNDQQQLGDGTTTMRTAPTLAAVPEAIKYLSVGLLHNCALGNSGAVYCWGSDGTGEVGDGTRAASRPVTVVSGLPATGVIAVAAGSQHSCALTVATVYCWGAEAAGELGDGGNGLRLTPVSLAGPAGLTFASLMAGTLRTCGITDIGGAYCWGVNGGTIGDGTFTDRPSPTPVHPPK